jgi:hypothetical protein
MHIRNLELGQRSLAEFAPGPNSIMTGMMCLIPTARLMCSKVGNSGLFRSQRESVDVPLFEVPPRSAQDGDFLQMAL